jgi:multicomponent Na+:H+ antiporter subunit G
MNVVVTLLLICGAAFLGVSCLGLIRLPDFYTRAHAVGKAETLGSMLILVALALHNGMALSSVKLLLILLIVAVTNPTAMHAIARAAIRSGLEIWKSKGEPSHP